MQSLFALLCVLPGPPTHLHTPMTSCSPMHSSIYNYHYAVPYHQLNGQPACSVCLDATSQYAYTPAQPTGGSPGNHQAPLVSHPAVLDLLAVAAAAPAAAPGDGGEDLHSRFETLMGVQAHFQTSFGVPLST
eukprot:1161371-Pelagomonas_calceolata.AAC.14